MPSATIQDTINKQQFVTDNAKEDLRILEERLGTLNAELMDFIQTRNTLRIVNDKSMHPNGFKTLMNLGCNFFMEAAVPDPTKLLLNIGLNCYLEFNLDEANKYLDRQIKIYEEKVTEIQDKAAETKAHLKLMLLGMHER